MTINRAPDLVFVMKKRGIPAIMAVALFLASVPMFASHSFAANLPVRVFVASLSAAPGVNTPATGEATFQLSPDGQTLNYTLTVSNIRNAFMAHIHLSPNADILVWLYPSPKAVASGGAAACIDAMSGGPVSSCPTLMSGPFTGVLAKGTITSADLNGSSTCPGCSGLSPRTMPNLIADVLSGKTYVIVHTKQNPASEVQGSITSVKATTTLTASPANSAVTATTFRISTTEFYAFAGLVLIFLVAAGTFALRARRPSS